MPRRKRVLDLLILLTTAPIWLPLLLALAAMVRLKMGSPVLFRQSRPGYLGRIFTIFKFRTMTDRRGADGNLLPDAQRLTSFGKWLRRTSLDELPEMLNILRGEMSLVGPRPLLVQYLGRYSCEEARRHHALPGLTGWAQINGRNAISWPEKFRLDVWYVDHWSLWLDLRILFRSVRQVCARQGVSAPGEATMPEFLGHDTPAEPPEILPWGPQKR